MTGTPIGDEASGDSKKIRIAPTHRVVLIVAAVVAAVILAYYLLPAVLGLWAPFPSDDTPLSAYNGGIVWYYDPADSYANPPFEVPYSNATFGIAYPGSGQRIDSSDYLISFGAINCSLATFDDYRNFSYEDSGSFRISGEETAQGIVWNTFWILITDEDVDGAWSPGDSISLFSCLALDNGSVIDEGVVKETEYAICLHLEPEYPSAFFTYEYHFAYHESRLYSWIPEERVLNNP